MQKPTKYNRESLKRYVDGLYTQADAESLFKSIHQEDGPVRMGEEMDHVWGEYTDTRLSEARYQQYGEEAKRLLKQIHQPTRRTNLRSLWKYAAVFILLLSIGVGFYLIKGETSQPEQFVYTKIQVEKGEHKRVLLPDGTRVILNAGTSLSYPVGLTSDIRLVEINGEAFFEVVKDEEKPFIVRTKSMDIKVLGTSFNVKAYEEDEQLAVSVEKGKVQVDMTDAMSRLVANEQFLLDKTNGEHHKRNENIKQVKSWIDGGLYFNRTPIRSVARELERMYNCKIEFAPNLIFDEYIYGEHDNKSLEAVLKSIRYSTTILYRKEGEVYILYK